MASIWCLFLDKILCFEARCMSAFCLSFRVSSPR